MPNEKEYLGDGQYAMTDIVERLRKGAQRIPSIVWASDIAIEAADEIERLRRALDMLGNQWEHKWGDADRAGVIRNVERIARIALGKGEDC